MLPAFPLFKKIEISDKPEIEQRTRSFSHYLDFNFTQLWCWNLYGETELSILNNCLVVRSRDPITKNLILSFCGTTCQSKTASSLLSENTGHFDHCKELRCIPDEVAAMLCSETFEIVADECCFDYVYDTKSLSTYEGSHLREKSKHVSAFSKAYPHAKIEELTLSDMETVNNIKAFFSDWVKWKKSRNKPYTAEEEEAFYRLIELRAHMDYRVLGVIDQEKILGFYITEKVNSDYFISHFCKCDLSIQSAHSFLVQGVAKAYAERGVSFMNFGEDMGLANLRLAKMLFRPVFQLKKYTVSLK